MKKAVLGILIVAALVAAVSYFQQTKDFAGDPPVGFIHIN